MSLRDALDGLDAALDQLKTVQRLPVVGLPEGSGAVGALREATHALVDAMSRIELAVSVNVQSLGALEQRLGSGSIVDDLIETIGKEADETSEVLANAAVGFQSLEEELVEEIGSWPTDAADRLAEELIRAIEDVDERVAQRIKTLGTAVKASILGIGDDVKQRVEDRCKGAVGDIVETAAERALIEISETIVTTEVGVMVTSAIGPYLPALIALKPTLPALQEALDAMRGGF